MRKRQFRGAIFSLMVASALLFHREIAAQVDTGAIVGQITDASGSTLPGTKITLREENTGITNLVQTNDGGEFIFSPLKLGTYTLTAEKAGFKTGVQRHIEVTIQSRLKVNIALQIGTVDESVQVNSIAPLLETQTSSLQQLVDARAINDLPLNGRNAVFLAQLSPGVTSGQNDSRNLQASGSFVANGARRTQNNYLLDGMDNNSSMGALDSQAQYVLMPPPDALREFTVQTSNYSAEFGHAAGAVLNISTKSGTNSFHGNLWEFLRNDMFDAKDYFVAAGQRKPEFRLNQFGGTVGGPLVLPHLYNGHDRTFFFLDYQGTRLVQGKTFSQNVPTLAEKTSGFTNLQDLITLQTGTRKDALNRTFPVGTVFDPVTTRAVTNGSADSVTGLTATSTGYVRDPFYSGSLVGKSTFTDSASVGQMNQISSGRIDPNAVRLLNLFPDPNGPGLLGNYVVNPNNVLNTDSFDVRFDHNFSSKDSAFLRYSFMYSRQQAPRPFQGVADGEPNRPASGRTKSSGLAASWTHILGPHYVNEARIGYSRVWDYRGQGNADVMGIPDQYGIPGVPQVPHNGGLPLMDFGQLSSIGAAGFLPDDKASDVLQTTENLTIDHSHHQIRIGFEFQHILFPSLGPTYSRGYFVHSGIFTSVVNSTDSSTDRAQFIITPQQSPYDHKFDYLGGANTVEATSAPSAFHPMRNYYGAYVQDNWRLTPRLTINAGLRYDFIGVPGERDGLFGNLVTSYSGESPDSASHYYFPAEHLSELPQAFVNVLANNNIQLTPTTSHSFGFAQHTNFAPRVGFAFQPMTKMSIRGGYGLFYQGNENHGLSTSPFINFPFQVTSVFTAGSATQAIIEDKVNHSTPEGTIGSISQGLSHVSVDPQQASVSSLSFNGESRNPKTAYSQAFNLQVQYQVSPSTLLFVGYVGSNSRHIQTNIPLNNTNTINAPTVSYASVAFFPTIATGGAYISHKGSSNYNSLQFGAERRFSNGLSFTANMTYSKCLGNIHDMLDNGVGGYRGVYIPGLGIGADTTLCDTDSKRIIHTAGTYELPFGKKHHWLHSGVGAWIAGGWSTNWIFTAQDGHPVSIACSSTHAVGLGCFALKKPGVDPYAGPHNADHFLNASAFMDPPVATSSSATIANLGGPGGQVTGPPFRRFDASIFRRFSFICESYFEFRLEVFNVTNTPNFGQPGSLNFNTPSSFARISATRDNPNDPRELQLSAKYYF